MEEKEIKKNLKSKSNWMRLIFMILFSIAYSIAEVVFFALVVFQFLSKIVTGSLNKNVSRFSSSLTVYIKQVLDFLSYANDVKPYPLSDWPSSV